MPIANCILAPDCSEGSGDLIKLWAKASRQSSEHMTLNLIASNQQFGNPYKIMATLILPTLWSSADVSALQMGLAKALEQYFDIDSAQVHVVTTIVDSGRVVENGEEVVW